ncbi:cation:dicarboxylase symporter family transporter [bacterium]|nr:cation:dicarboxylase symporter family transporter [bacterium]
MQRTITFLILAALIAGVGAGAALQAFGNETLIGAAGVAEAVGALWLKALKATVIPLVAALLITGVASVADAASAGRLAGRAIGVFGVMLAVSAAYAVAAILGLLALFPVGAAEADALLAGVGATRTEAAAFDIGSWLQQLVPSNPIRAAADDQILAFTVFAIAFGFAATRLPSEQRQSITSFFKAVAEAMILIVRWVLVLAPVGVFGLSIGVGLRSGLGAAGVLLHYIVLVSAVIAGVTVIAVLFAVIWGRRSPAAFLSAAAPVQAMAFSTQSSIACLPAMVEQARDAMGLPERVVDLVLPLSVAVFRMTSAAGNLGVAFFIAAVHGIEPTGFQIASAVLVAVPISIGSVGLPGQVSFVASVGPICLALGVPLELLGILIAVEVVPDIFRTVGNVTADLAAAVIVNRREATADAAPEPQ